MLASDARGCYKTNIKGLNGEECQREILSDGKFFLTMTTRRSCLKFIPLSTVGFVFFGLPGSSQTACAHNRCFVLTDIFDTSVLLAAVPTYPKTVVIIPALESDSFLKQVCPSLDASCVA